MKNQYSNTEICKDTHLDILKDVKIDKLENNLKTFRRDNIINNTELEMLNTLTWNTSILENSKSMVSNIPATCIYRYI